MQIRPATVVDARAIAEVHVASWQATYRGVIADDVLDGPGFRADRLQLWQRLLAGLVPDGAAKVQEFAGATITEVRYRRSLA